jgi:hypothetical protein
LSLYSARNIPLYAIIAAPIIGFYISGITTQYSATTKLEKNIQGIESQLKGYAIPLVIILATSMLFYKGIPLDINRKGNQFESITFPVKAVDWLKQNPQSGNMFNFFPWGGYLLFRLWPSERVFIDGQTDFYGEGLTREYASAISANLSWDDVLNKYQIQWVIIPSESDLSKELAKTNKWKTLYQDETAIIFSK